MATLQKKSKNDKQNPASQSFLTSFTNPSRGTMIAGGLALFSLGLLGYALTRPTKEKKIKTARKKKLRPKGKKFTKTFRSKPLNIHLCMSSEEGFHAHVAGDKKNRDLKLKFGSKVLKINGDRVEHESFENIHRRLLCEPLPIEIEFREESELEEAWGQALSLKEQANDLYGKKQFKEASDLVSQAIDLHPTNRVFYSNRVLMYLKMNAYDKALVDCHKIRSCDPLGRFIKGHYLRGFTLFSMKEWKHAASAFQTVLKRQPDYHVAQDRLKECNTHIAKEQSAKERARRDSTEAFRRLAMSKQRDQGVDEKEIEEVAQEVESVQKQPIQEKNGPGGANEEDDDDDDDGDDDVDEDEEDDEERSLIEEPRPDDDSKIPEASNEKEAVNENENDDYDGDEAGENDPDPAAEDDGNGDDPALAEADEPSEDAE